MGLKVGNAFSCLLSSGQCDTATSVPCGSDHLCDAATFAAADEMSNIAFQHHEHGAYLRGLGEESELSHTVFC